MLLLIVLSLAYAQIQDEKQLTNVACVIFSKYYLQSYYEMTSKVIGEMIQSQGLQQDEAVMCALASLVESCLDKINTQKTMEIIQQLQQQKINLEAHEYLVNQADLTKFGSKKKNPKKNEIFKIIKSIDDMMNQQKQEQEGNNNGNDQSDGGRKRQRNNKGKQQELSDLSIFELKEWLVLSSFVLVGVLLSYIICCVPERSKKEKKNKVKSQEQDNDNSSQKKQEENQPEDEGSPKKVAENEDKQKVE